MNVITPNIRGSILKSAKAEFLRCGYEKASLRAICRKAGVTTGAFYSHFRSKEELIHIILAEEIGEGDWEAKLGEFGGPPTAEAIAKAEISFVKYALEHRDVCLLLMDCAEGSPYQGYWRKVLQLFEQLIRSCVAHSGVQVRAEAVHLVAISEFERCCQMIREDYDEDTLAAIEPELYDFIIGGLTRLGAA